MQSESPRRRPTLSDVAELAGTSVPTVSKVLRGGTDVSPSTRLRVMEAVRETGYRRRGSGGQADVLTQQPTMIDLVVNHVEGSWANSVLTGVEAAAAAADIDVVISMATHGRDWASRLLRRPSSGAVVVLVDPSSTQFRTLAAANVPVVLIDPMSRPPHEVPSVGVADWDGGRTAAEHLLGLGHRHFGIIAGGRNHLYSRARVDGFRSEVEMRLTKPSIHVAHADWNRQRARDESRRLLEAHPEITAFFGCSDIMALGIYDAIADLDLTIPNDISVVGFDDVPEAQTARPPLTTVRQPTAEMGATAVRMLLAAMTMRPAAFEAEPARIEMAADLIVRGSTSARVDP
ncbi:LacI family DNA-binding transcriptional regulator [Planctomonas sp. JC2975]|uniref:LacI family DNA-binding transcriptional regulator n=1 Tax=Planctomonas sp. JC2975 TaxID=2729626 RepID=UPI0014731D4D|nr:LacI family DNA-binding transcriptional regulator [Planctomonas sp. JC2975]NNC12881.1 LacI family DNA-binding transcriptional regulator [Planctomonas sp. JC2975]